MKGILEIVSEQDLPETLELIDPRAMRALAHEARLKVVNELYAGEPMTATEAAARVGLTPSAMSYHLRALAKWGIVLPAESTDGRERRWRAAARNLNLAPATVGEGGRAAASFLVGTVMREMQDAVSEFLATTEGDERRHASVRRSRLRLTDEEAEAFNAEVEALLEKYDALAQADGKGASRRDWDHFLVGVPRTPIG